MSEEDEQLCMSYALGALDPGEREVFEAQLAETPALAEKVREFETLYAEQELGDPVASNTRLKEAIMTQISGDQATTTTSPEATEPMLASQAIWLIVFGVVIVVACLMAFGVSLVK